MLWFLHHHDRPNQGDALSGPYQYFDFGEYKKLSWDKDILEPGNQIQNNDTVIMGGGIYFTKNKPRFSSLIKKSKYFIGWGIGLDPRINIDEQISNFSLVGTRERKIVDTKPENTFYVPCASCMHEAFNSVSATHINRPPPTKEFCFHLNGGFNKQEILKKLPDSKNHTTTTSNFQAIISNLINSDCVVTNSYHGAYWGSLLGKKVVCIKTDVPKWDGLHENVIFVDIHSMQQGIKKAKPIPADYIKECRSINSNFFTKVKNHINN